HTLTHAFSLCTLDPHLHLPLLYPTFLFLFLLMLPPPPRSTLFPYTTLFRSLGHDAGRRLEPARRVHVHQRRRRHAHVHRRGHPQDRKSTRLNSSHRTISYAVFCLKKKK